MADASATSVAATTAAAVAEEEFASEHGSEEVAPSSAGGASSLSAVFASTGSSPLNQIDRTESRPGGPQGSESNAGEGYEECCEEEETLAESSRPAFGHRPCRGTSHAQASKERT